MEDLKSFKEVDDVFNKRQYIHFITLKPPNGVDRSEEVQSLMRYLVKRNVQFWIVECDSEEEYKHYHGIVSYPDDMSPEGMLKARVAFQRKVNRDIGFCYPLQQVLSVYAIYKYIRGLSNLFINEWLTEDI